MYGDYARDVGPHINELASIPKVLRQILIYTEEQGGMGERKLHPGKQKVPTINVDASSSDLTKQNQQNLEVGSTDLWNEVTHFSVKPGSWEVRF